MICTVANFTTKPYSYDFFGNQLTNIYIGPQSYTSQKLYLVDFTKSGASFLTPIKHTVNNSKAFEAICQYPDNDYLNYLIDISPTLFP
jgi:hypothetical protein